MRVHIRCIFKYWYLYNMRVHLSLQTARILLSVDSLLLVHNSLLLGSKCHWPIALSKITTCSFLYYPLVTLCYAIINVCVVLLTRE